nr:protein TONNEAU 1A-like [Ipomoea batatas]
MDDYTREMMDLKTLVTRTLEKKGVLAKIRAELRASVFEAIEGEDRVIEKEEGLPPALLGSCNDRAKQLHNSPSGRLLTALICEYLDWAQLNHTSKVYLPECNLVIMYCSLLQKDFWKSELKEFSSKNGYDINRNGDSGPLLLDVLEGFLKYEFATSQPPIARLPIIVVARHFTQSPSPCRTARFPSHVKTHRRSSLLPLGSHLLIAIAEVGERWYCFIGGNMKFWDLKIRNLSQARGAGRRLTTADGELETRNVRRPSSVAGGLPPLGRKDEYNWRYDSDEDAEDVVRASAALENLQLDRKARNLTTSWRHAGDSDADGRIE